MKRTLLFLLCSLTLLVAEENRITHVVLCWMDSTVTNNEITTLINETQSLESIPGIESLTVGVPLPSDRPIVDDSFSFGITMTFPSSEAMNSYLTDERHTSFVDTQIKPRLSKLVIYDIEGTVND